MSQLIYCLFSKHTGKRQKIKKETEGVGDPVAVTDSSFDERLHLCEKERETSYKVGVGEGYNITLSQSSVGIYVNEVKNVMTREMADDWIVDQTWLIYKRIQIRFTYLFPDVFGVIDCSHIAIVAPPRHDELYPARLFYNRKGYYSLNIQFIIDCHLRIININARFPGFVHDAAIRLQSNIHRYLQNKQLDNTLHYQLLEDEVYPLTPWLLTKYPGEYPDSCAFALNRTCLAA
ncbi:DDE superfamily endonuclease [Popillia japonica]|uniref:DDE superfamily endonuclease n=1 Tax=Popillia japonica TaxID=7064 RepID=A0AAW1L7V5_POPJA